MVERGKVHSLVLLAVQRNMACFQILLQVLLAFLQQPDQNRSGGSGRSGRNARKHVLGAWKAEDDDALLEVCCSAL